MLNAFVRLFSISFIVIFATIILALSFRFLGSSSYRGSGFEHPLKSFLETNPTFSAQKAIGNSLLYLRVTHTEGQWMATNKNFNLDDLLNSKTKLFLQVEGRANVPFNKLATLINRANKTEDIIIGADYLQTLKVARKVEPRFLYTSHDNQVLQLNMISNVFMDKLASTKYDVVALIETSKNKPSLKARKELKERNINIIELIQ